MSGEKKKRLPWWLVVSAGLLMLLAVVVGFIETVGRRGTIVGRYERIDIESDRDQAVLILGKPDAEGDMLIPDSQHVVDWGLHWREGPAEVWIRFVDRGSFREQLCCDQKAVRVNSSFSLWHLRRWAEQAYTAIHGPRR